MAPLPVDIATSSWAAALKRPVYTRRSQSPVFILHSDDVSREGAMHGGFVACWVAAWKCSCQRDPVLDSIGSRYVRGFSRDGA